MPTDNTVLLDAYSPRVLADRLRASGDWRSLGDEFKSPEDLTTDHVRDTIDTVREALQSGWTSTKRGYAKFTDLLQTKELTRFVEASIVEVMRDAIQPNLVIVPNLFTQIMLEAAVPSIRITTLGQARVHEIAEGADYKESDFEADEEAQRVDITIKKYGGLIRITEEALQMNMVDLVRMWIQKMGTSMAQHKEKVAIQMLNRFGTVILDSVTPANSVLGLPTGRGIDGAANGTMSMNDFLDFWAHLQMRGFNGDTLLMNPMAWKLFMANPETREIVLNNNTLVSNKMPNGSYAPGWGTSFNGLGERHVATGLTSIDPALGKLGVSAFTGALATNHNLSMLGSTFQIAPGAMFPGALKLIITPYAGYRAASTPSGAYLTDIYLVDSSACGVLVQKELPTIEEFNDPWKDIRVTKVRERYGFGILEQGKGIAIAKNIVIDRNYNFENVNSRTLSAIDRSTGVPTL